MIDSDQIHERLTEIRDEIRALAKQELEIHADNVRLYEDASKRTESVGNKKANEARNMVVSYLTLLVLLMGTAIVMLIWNR